MLKNYIGMGLSIFALVLFSGCGSLMTGKTIGGTTPPVGNRATADVIDPELCGSNRHILDPTGALLLSYSSPHDITSTQTRIPQQPAEFTLSKIACLHGNGIGCSTRVFLGHTSLVYFNRNGETIFLYHPEDGLYSVDVQDIFKLEKSNAKSLRNLSTVKKVKLRVPNSFAVEGSSPSDDIDEERDRLDYASLDEIAWRLNLSSRHELTLTILEKEQRRANSPIPWKLALDHEGLSGVTYIGEDTIDISSLSSYSGKKRDYDGINLATAYNPALFRTPAHNSCLVTDSWVTCLPENDYRKELDERFAVFDYISGKVLGYHTETHLFTDYPHPKLVDRTIKQHGDYSINNFSISTHSKQGVLSLYNYFLGKKIVIFNDNKATTKISCTPKHSNDNSVHKSVHILSKPGFQLKTRLYQPEQSKGIVAYFPGGPRSRRTLDNDFSIINKITRQGYSILIPEFSGSLSTPYIANRLKDNSFTVIDEELSLIETYLDEQWSDSKKIMLSISYGASYYLSAINSNFKFDQYVLVAPWLKARKYSDLGRVDFEKGDVRTSSMYDVKTFGVSFNDLPNEFSLTQQYKLTTGCTKPHDLLVFLGGNDLTSQREDLGQCGDYAKVSVNPKRPHSLVIFDFFKTLEEGVLFNDE